MKLVIMFFGGLASNDSYCSTQDLQLAVLILGFAYSIVEFYEHLKFMNHDISNVR